MELSALASLPLPGGMIRMESLRSTKMLKHFIKVATIEQLNNQTGLLSVLTIHYPAVHEVNVYDGEAKACWQPVLTMLELSQVQEEDGCQK